MTHINMLITHIKLTRTKEGPQCHLGNPGSVPGEGWESTVGCGAERMGSPGPSEASGRGHQTGLYVISTAAPSSG